MDKTSHGTRHTNGETGTGADIAIIDTGIDDDHPDVQANVGTGKAYAQCRGRNCNQPWSDDNDHGTHCAGIAAATNNSQGVVVVAAGNAGPCSDCVGYPAAYPTVIAVYHKDRQSRRVLFDWLGG